MTEDVEYRAASQEEKKKTTEKIHGCGDGGHADFWWRKMLGIG